MRENVVATDIDDDDWTLPPPPKRLGLAQAVAAAIAEKGRLCSNLHMSGPCVFQLRVCVCTCVHARRLIADEDEDDEPIDKKKTTTGMRSKLIETVAAAAGTCMRCLNMRPT